MQNEEFKHQLKKEQEYLDRLVDEFERSKELPTKTASHQDGHTFVEAFGCLFVVGGGVVVLFPFPPHVKIVLILAITVIGLGWFGSRVGKEHRNIQLQQNLKLRIKESELRIEKLKSKI